jgi:hypothetical protein
MRCKITNLPSKYTPYSNPEENTRDEFMQYHIGATADSQIALLVVPGISPAVSMMILVSIASIDSVLLTQGITINRQCFVDSPINGVTSTADSVHARPERRDTRGRLVPGRFDTVLVNDGNGDITRLKGLSDLQTNMRTTYLS